MPNLNLQQWLYIFIGVVLLDLLVFGGVVYYFATIDPISAAVLPPTGANLRIATLTATATPWAGPGLRVTPTPTWPPTPVATRILTDNGFPEGYIAPTPRPTIEKHFSLNLNYSLFFRRLVGSGGLIDVPDINQTLYPEPFFRAGSNNACGPVALFAALKGLGANIVYEHVRNIAVNNEFGRDGMTVSGLVNTAIILNNYLRQPFVIEQSRSYHLQDLVDELRAGGVIIVLVSIKKVDGQYQIANPGRGTIGHFLVVEQINLVSGRVTIGGSTLGMGDIPLADFVSSWSNEPQKQEKKSFRAAWRNALREENTPGNWALVIRRR